jgi:hypothetical protein
MAHTTLRDKIRFEAQRQHDRATIPPQQGEEIPPHPAHTGRPAASDPMQAETTIPSAPTEST